MKRTTSRAVATDVVDRVHRRLRAQCVHHWVTESLQPAERVLVNGVGDLVVEAMHWENQGSRL